MEWATDAGLLTVIEPTDDELAPHVDALVAAYNDPRNASLLGHTSDLCADDVRDHYISLRTTGAHPVLFQCDGVLAGDGDLRGVGAGIAEFAFLIAAPSQQGRGLGTRFATMVHAYAFGTLQLARVYASVIPTNVASLRVFEKLGYTFDSSATAREFADEGDLTLSIGREQFSAQHAAAMAAIRIMR